jgi:hypothetical protein
MSSKSRQAGFVNDGFKRAYVGIRNQVRFEVEAEYAARLESASFFERRVLKREIRAEFERRVRERLPSSKSLF